MTENNRLMPDSPWLAVLSLALGALVLVASEFLPASLLSSIANDLNVSVGMAGQTVTVTAACGAIVAPIIGIATRRMDRRDMLLILGAVLIVSNVLAGVSHSIVTLLVARAFLGASVAGFWALVGAVATQLVSEAEVARATSLIFAGVSVATVCAAPAGVFLGAIAGWRITFLTVASFGAIVLVIQFIYLPRLPRIGSPTFVALCAVALRPSVRRGLLAVILLAAGHFSAFTYIRPLLEDGSAVLIQTLSALLLGFGVAGFFGNLVAGSLVRHELPAVAISAPFALGVATIALALFSSFLLPVALLVALWGFSFGMVPISLQTWMMKTAPDQPEIVSGLFIATFQVAIASGAAGGGAIANHAGVKAAVLAGGGLAVAAGFVLWNSRPSLQWTETIILAGVAAMVLAGGEALRAA